MLGRNWFKPQHPVFPILLLFVTTLVFTYPTIFQLSNHLIGGSDDAWICPWNAFQFRETVLKGKDPYYTDFLFAPVGSSLLLNANTEFNSAFGLLFSPWFNEVAQANLAILLATFLSAVGAYLLTLDLTQNRLAALFAGIGFAFCPFRILRMAGHTNFATSQWLPLSYWSFLRMANTGKGKYAVITGVFFALNYYSNQYYTVYLTIAFVVMCLYGIWKIPEWRSVRFIRNLVVSGAIASVLLLPVAWRFYQDAKEGVSITFIPSKTLAERTAAHFEDYFKPGPYNPLIQKIVDPEFFWGPHGKFTAGWIVTFSGLIGIYYAIRERRHILILFALLGLLFLLFSLGPYMEIGSYQIPTPYYLLKNTPLVNHVRIPSRFAVMVTLSLVVISAYTIARLSERKVLVGILFGLMAFELFPAPIYMEAFQPPAGLYHLREMHDGTMLTLPLYIGNAFASRPMSYQLAHRKKLIAGRTARGGPWEVEQYYTNLPISQYFLRISATGPHENRSVERDRELAPVFRRFFDVQYLTVHPPFSKNPEVRKYLNEIFPDAKLLSEESGIAVYELPVVSTNMIQYKGGQPGMRFFLFLNWELDETGEKRAFVCRKNSAQFLLPVLSENQEVELEVKARSTFEPLINDGKLRLTLDHQIIGEFRMRNDYQSFIVRIPGKDLQNAHQVVKLNLIYKNDVGTVETEDSLPRIELQSIRATIH